MRTGPLSLLATVLTSAALAHDEDCSRNLRIIVARGTGEDPGTGVAGEWAEQIARRVNGTDIVAVDYPASALDPPYTESVAEGDDAMREVISEYDEHCPGSKMVLIGLSQGAHVTMDVLCGGTGGVFDDDPAISRSLIKDSVIAIVLFGDPSHVANTTYDKGTSIRNGVFPRKNITACQALSDRLVSYCDTGDVFCDSGNNRSTHGSYFDVYGDQAVEFVVDRYLAAENDTSAGGGGGGGSGGDEPSGSSSDTGSTSPTATGGGTGGSASETGEPGNLAPGLALPETGFLALMSLLVLGVVAV